MTGMEVRMGDTLEILHGGIVHTVEAITFEHDGKGYGNLKVRMISSDQVTGD